MAFRKMMVSILVILMFASLFVGTVFADNGTPGNSPEDHLK
ncbi:hypothetical protein [Salisediminibacterium selenitireducens]|nr:hypothetical protein [Salisediminibacterium selenitireducens]